MVYVDEPVCGVLVCVKQAPIPVPSTCLTYLCICPSIFPMFAHTIHLSTSPFTARPGTKCVYFMTDFQNFTVARKVCQKLGKKTDLASIHSAGEQGVYGRLAKENEEGLCLLTHRESGHLVLLLHSFDGQRKWMLVFFASFRQTKMVSSHQ